MSNCTAPINGPEEHKIISFVNEKSVFYHPLKFMEQEYANNLDTLTKRFSMILGSLLTTGLIKNKKAHFLIRTLQYLIITALLIGDFILRVKNYKYRIKLNKADSKDKIWFKMCELLGNKIDTLKEPDYNLCTNYDLNVSSNVITWILSMPITEDFQLKYYDFNDFKEITNRSHFEGASKTIKTAILIEYKQRKFVWELEAFFNDLTQKLAPKKSNLWMQPVCSDDSFSEIYNAILLEYFKTLDCSKHIIKFDEWGCPTTELRRSLSENLNQFDMPSFYKEIRYILKNGLKYTFGFVGVPGTGKSSILRGVEQEITEYPVIYLTAEDFESPYRIEHRFKIAKSFQPCILMIEDLDACELKTKNRKVGTFLDCIDDVNKDLNMVIIFTVNDTSLVHSTIINRAGRSDRVREIKAPQTLEEVARVVDTRLSNHDFKLRIPLRSQKHNIYKCFERCLNNKFTQADITCGVVDTALINIGMDEAKIDYTTLIEYLHTAIDKHLETKAAIKSCNFKGSDDFSNNCNYPDDIKEAVEENGPRPRNYN